MSTKCFYVFCTLLPLLASANTLHLPKNHPVPGGVAIVALPTNTKQVPTAHFHEKPVLVVPADTENQWQAVVGIPLSQTTKSGTVQLQTPRQHSIIFAIKKKRYRIQRLRIKNIRKVLPAAKDQKRIDKEKRKIAKIIARWSHRQPLAEKFSPPLHGPITSVFGLKRFFNGHPRSPHNGLDIAAPTGTPIKAAAGGIVLATANLFYTGNTVYIDHGRGLITMYAHLNTIKVKPGRHVAQNTVIGTVGTTGRVTGPHLHWTIYLNQYPIDPLTFVSSKMVHQEPKKT